MKIDESENIRKWKEFFALVGYPPPKIQCPSGTLEEDALEKLRDRPDLVRWAIGDE